MEDKSVFKQGLLSTRVSTSLLVISLRSLEFKQNFDVSTQLEFAIEICSSRKTSSNSCEFTLVHIDLLSKIRLT